MVLLLLAASSQSPWLYWLSALSISALLVSAVSAHLQVRGLSLHFEAPIRATEGEELAMTFKVKNGASAERCLVLLRDLGPVPPGTARTESGPAPGSSRKAVRKFIPRAGRANPLGRKTKPSEEDHPILMIRYIAAGSTATLSYARSCPGRGIYENWKFLVYSEGILGLGRAWRVLEIPCRVIVRPSFVVPRSLPALETRSRHLEKRPSSVPGRDVQYRGVREYVPGDPLRDIHWKASAHRGRLVVKLYDDEAGPAASIFIHNRLGGADPALLKGALDVACRIAASISAYCAQRGVPFSLWLTHGDGSPSLAPRGLEEALDWLAGVQPSEGVAARTPGLVVGETAFHIFPITALTEVGREKGGVLAACLVMLGDGRDRPGDAPPFPPVSWGGVSRSGLVVKEGDDLKICLESLY